MKRITRIVFGLALLVGLAAPMALVLPGCGAKSTDATLVAVGRTSTETAEAVFEGVVLARELGKISAEQEAEVERAYLAYRDAVIQYRNAVKDHAQGVPAKQNAARSALGLFFGLAARYGEYF